jgi:hypothetical protein
MLGMTPQEQGQEQRPTSEAPTETTTRSNKPNRGNKPNKGNKHQKHQPAHKLAQ